MNIDAELIDSALAATRPRRSLLLGRPVIVGAGLVALLSFALFAPPSEAADWVVAATPLLMLLMLFVVGWATARRRQRMRSALTGAWEAAQLEQWDEAAERLAPLCERPFPTDDERGQALMLLASLAERQGRYDVAQHGYEALLREDVGDPLQQQLARISLADMQVRAEELTDAIESLTRLERMPMTQAVRAAQELVRLFQQVFMGQYADAVEAIAERRERFRRHLSTRAGFGYALLSAALHALGRTEEAAAYWRDATLLVRPERLLAEYALLSPVSAVYPAREWPL